MRRHPTPKQGPATKSSGSQSKAVYTKWLKNTGDSNQGEDSQRDTSENNEAIKKGGKTGTGSKSAVKAFRLKQEALKKIIP